MEKKKNLQSVPVIAKLFDISDRHVQRLAAAGVLPYESQRPYKFDLLPTIRAYINYLRKRIEEQNKDEKIEQVEYETLRAEANYKQHKAAILRMKVKHMEDQFHEAEDVRDAYEDLTMLIHDRIMELPELCADDVAAAGSDMEASNIIRSACYRILNELAEYKYDPEAAEQRRKDHGKK